MDINILRMTLLFTNHVYPWALCALSHMQHSLYALIITKIVHFMFYNKWTLSKAPIPRLENRLITKRILQKPSGFISFHSIFPKEHLTAWINNDISPPFYFRFHNKNRPILRTRRYAFNMLMKFKMSRSYLSGFNIYNIHAICCGEPQ